MRPKHAWRSYGIVVPLIFRANRYTTTKHTLDLESGDHSEAQDARLIARQVHNRRFDSRPATPAVEDQQVIISKTTRNMFGGGGGDPSRWIRARSDDWFAVCFDESQRDRMRRTPDRGSPAKRW